MSGVSPLQFPHFVLVVFFALISSVSSLAQDSSAAQPAIAARPLITQAIDDAQVTVLKGNRHPFARAEFDLGTAPASLPMQRMLLVLKRSPEQQSALKKLLDDQQDKASPSYHRWLTPEQFGKQFGPRDSDLQTITAWLQSHGFQVSPTKGRTMLEFSGSASQVREAFHTAIHKYVVNGEQHWANGSDPQIPAALTPAVGGIFTLHNFLKKPKLHMSEQRVAARVRPGKSPEITFSDGKHGLGPQDYATIYNSHVFAGGSNGSGTTIGVVGRSNLFNGAEDVNDFHNYAFQFGGGTFSVILNGPDPGDLGGGEEAEATLDSSWTGAVAPGATVDLVVSATTNTTDGVDLSELYIVENNLADVMTESFGSCEYFATDSEVAGVNGLAEQAAAQGISYFVSTGDNGAAGCDDPNEPSALYPPSVNLLASTPFAVAVGGTVFNEGGHEALYWSSTNTGLQSALSYIPENVWNDSCSSATCGGANANLWAGSGGASTGNGGVAAGTFTGFQKPAWQSGATGIPNDGVRDLPDVSLSAASHDPYLVCLGGSCVPDSQGRFFIYFVWGTSAAAPSFAGVMAIVDQQMFNLGQNRRQGQPNYVLYRLAASQNTSLAQCNGSRSTPPAASCNFNDTTIGNNAVPGELNYGTPSAKYQAAVGYDLATGLGSVNVANLIANWNSVTFNPTTTILDLNPKTNITHGSPVSVSVAVTPSTGSGTPTGDVSLIASVGGPISQTGVDRYSLSNGLIANSTTRLPGGGPYSVVAHYAGDANYGGSDSTPISMTVTAEDSTTAVSGAFTQDRNGFYKVPFSTGPYGSPVFVRADVQGTSGQGAPTGVVTFADTSVFPIPGNNAIALNSAGNTSLQSAFFDAGTHTISANYGGDASFKPSTTTQTIAFTIQPGFFTSLGAAPLVNISAAGLTGSIPINVFASTGFSAVSFACSGLPAESTCVFSPATVTGNGQTTVTVTTTGPHITRLLDQRPYYLARWLTGSGFALAGIFVLGSPRRRRHGLPLLLITLALLLIIPACGGGGGSHHQQDPGTPAGNYVVSVTATGGSIVQTSSFELVVQ